MMKIHPLKKYPVDLYYLVDVSASMHNNIEKLNSVGNDLSRKMAFFSHDFRLGFGSYVDKTVSPYISIHPERIHNQCRYLLFDVTLINEFLLLNLILVFCFVCFMQYCSLNSEPHAW
jgi:hypothetical protein